MQLISTVLAEAQEQIAQLLDNPKFSDIYLSRPVKFKLRRLLAEMEQLQTYLDTYTDEKDRNREIAGA